MSASSSLADLAQQFATNLTTTVRAVVPGAAPFRALAGTGQQSDRLYVRQDPAEGIALAVDGSPLLRLKVDFLCTLDHKGSYLAVEKSELHVLAAGASEPLLRYEYLRSPDSSQAGAHLQVHAHRDAISYVMAKCGGQSQRARRREKSATAGHRVPALADLHLPLGGARFRPCVEDILQMLIDELGVDAPAGAIDALAEGRANWRRDQLGAAVRDSPETAARVLGELGYEIGRPPKIPPDRIDRLRAI